MNRNSERFPPDTNPSTLVSCDGGTSTSRKTPFEPLNHNPYSSDGIAETCIVFDIGAEFGHFRKPHSTASAETFGIPPRTTVAGLVAGMLGLPRNSYYNLFGPDCSRVAVSIERSIARQSLGVNLLDTRGSDSMTRGAKTAKYVSEHRDPTSISVVSEPKYRIYVAVDSPDFMNDVDAVVRGADSAKQGVKPVYTPSLGKARHLAWIDYIGRFHMDDRTASDEVEIRSAVPGDPIPLVVDTDVRYVSERMPAYMEASEDGGRVAAGSRRMTYGRGGESLILKEAEYTAVGDDNIVFE